MLWAGYCLFGVPMQMQRGELELYNSQSRVCYDVHSSNPIQRKDCLDSVETMYQRDVAPWQWKNYYQTKWLYILAVLVLVPMAAYLACRAGGLAFVWIVRGFRT